MMNLLKLVKYDWKRNAGFMLVLGALFVLVEAGLTVYGGIKKLDNEFVYVLSFVFYLAVTIMVCVTTCRTYEHNLRFFNRRLLPLPGLYTILSPLVLGFGGLAVIGVIGVLHLLAMGMVWDNGILMISDVLGERGFWSMLVSCTMFIVVIFLSITVAKLFIGKKGVWIGIALFFVVQLVFDWLENLLFPNMAVSTDQFFESVSVRVSDSANATINVQATVTNFWGPLIFETAAIVAMICIMNYLINRRIQTGG